MKSCTRCLETKPLPEFRTNPKMRSGWDSWCKACAAAHRSARRREISSLPKTPPVSKRCSGCAAIKLATAFCIERGMKDGLSRICRECRSEKHRRNFAKDPAAWRAKARESHYRRITNPSFIVHKRVSARVGEWLGTKKGGRKCFDLLGYSLDELKAHLERQFVRGMGWANMGEWHIDHIVPLASFTITGPDDPELRRAWALPNLRPLWAADNLRKHAKREVLL